MSHRKKVEASSKFIYILILSAGVLMAVTVLFSLLAGLRINFIYSTLINSAIEVKLNIAEARREFLKNINEPNEEALKNAWDYLNLAEFNTNLLLEEKDKLSILALPVNNIKLKEQVQQLQVMLLEYRRLSSNLADSKQPDTTTVDSKIKWESQFEQLNYLAQNVQTELRRLLDFQIKNFKLTQFILIGATLILSFLSVFVFYRYEKQRSTFLRRLEDASTTIEKGTHKTTITEGVLQETQRKLTTLVQNLPGIVYRAKNDPKYTFEYVSDMCLLITGYKAEELINNKVTSYSDLINPEDKQKVREQIQIAVEARKPFQLVYRIKTSGGYEKWIWEKGVGIFSEIDDELIALEGFITDITEQKMVQDQLALQSSALDAAANGILITDKEGKILWVNNAFTQLTGFTVNEILGQKPSIFKSGEHADSFYAHMWSVILAGNTWRGEIINKKKDSTTYYEEMIITPIKNTSGEVIHFVSVKQDITERKKSENALRESELRFRGLFENATVGIYRTSIDGKFLMANPTLLKILGYDTFDELSNSNAKDAYIIAGTRETFKQQLLKKNRIFGFESQWRRKDDTIIYIRESARLVKDEDENPIYFEGTIEDITEKKKAEEELIVAKERAEQSDRLKSEFLAQMSHEIRTPLNVIMSFTNLIKEEFQDKVDKELKEGLEVVDVEGKRIMRTIDLIVSMSQLQTGQYDYKPNKFDLYQDILKKLYLDFLPASERKNIQLRIMHNTNDTLIYAEEYSVNQIFYHLIDNAIKYTPKGKVEVSIGRDSHNRLYVDVIDTGIGISEEYQKMLYVPFTKEERGYTRSYEGNGLGLALAKKYCELNKASIKVKSIKGKGTAFRVTFV